MGRAVVAQMLTKKKKKEMSRKRWRKDWISQLPYHLLYDILSHLSTKEAVRTSVLSTTWRNLWLWVPSLELNSQNFIDFNAFVIFGDMFFDSDRVSCIDKVKLTIDEIDGGVDDKSYFTSWIDALVKRRITHLDVKCLLDPESHEMPLTFYICKTLVYLKLALVSFVDVEFVSLPCLKTMHLEDNFYPNEATFERIVSSCPLLEELKIVNPEVFRVLSRSLIRLIIRVSRQYSGSRVVIDAPQLRFLSIYGYLLKSFTITNMDSNAKLDISLKIPSNMNSTRSFFFAISRVRDMMISSKTIQFIRHYATSEWLPQFGCVSRLCVTLYLFDLIWLPSFLESCPNLKSLILKWEADSSNYLEVKKPFGFSSVPKCLSSSLEYVDFETSILGYDSEMELVRYFLVNSATLKKLTLRLHYYARRQYDDIFNKLRKIPRRAGKCQVVVSHGHDQFNM